MEFDMDTIMMNSGNHTAFSGCSSTSSTTLIPDPDWDTWSPAIDWAHFSSEDAFNDLLDHFRSPPGPPDCSTNVSPTSTNCPGSPIHPDQPDDKSLRIVHLLMAAAEALSGSTKSPDLARVILARLRELLSQNTTTDTTANMDRLASHFTDALHALIDRHEDPPPNPTEFLEAFQLLQDMSPYVKFGHFTANQAILESVAGDRRVHIVDYDIMEGVQWASLIQAMVSSNEGFPSPPPHLRITAITRCGGGSRRPPGTTTTSVVDTGRRLAAFAASVGLSFSFGQVRLDSEDLLRPAAVKVVKGEAVVLNCALHAPNLLWRSAGSVASFLRSAGELGARLVTLVEEVVEGVEKEKEKGGFVDSFMDEMRRYSAIWDSLEAGFPMQGKARGVVERMILGPMIKGSVSRAYRRREEGGEREGWADWMEENGFGRKHLSFFNLCQSRLLLGLFNDGNRAEEDGVNKLVFCWKNCRLLSASVWSAPNSFSC